MAYPLLLHGKHNDPAPTYHPLGEWVVPWYFQDPEAEYQLLRTGCGLIDYSSQALIEVRGADRISFLHNLLTNDVKRLSPGSGCQAALLTPTGKLISDLIVLADEEALLLLCEANRAVIVAQTLDRYLFSEQVQIVNHDRKLGVLALQGPRTMEVITQCLGKVLSLPQPLDHAIASWQELPLRLIRYAIIGSEAIGILCLCPAERLLDVWEWWRSEGMRFGLGVVGWQALNTARLEMGTPWFGLDMDESTLLPETELEKLLASDAKGCYPGQEIVARLATYGTVSKRLMGILVESPQVPEGGDRILHDNKEVGRITSGCFSYALQQPIALGYVKRGSYERGTAVHIDRAGTHVSALVVARPLVRRNTP